MCVAIMCVRVCALLTCVCSRLLQENKSHGFGRLNGKISIYRKYTNWTLANLLQWNRVHACVESFIRVPIVASSRYGRIVFSAFFTGLWFRVNRGKRREFAAMMLILSQLSENVQTEEEKMSKYPS